MLLFRTEYGSRAMGMATEDSDHDIMEVLMQQAPDRTDLPEHANLDKINTMLHGVYLEGWQTKWWETK